MYIHVAFLSVYNLIKTEKITSDLKMYVEGDQIDKRLINSPFKFSIVNYGILNP